MNDNKSLIENPDMDLREQVDEQSEALQYKRRNIIFANSPIEPPNNVDDVTATLESLVEKIKELSALLPDFEVSTASLDELKNILQAFINSNKEDIDPDQNQKELEKMLPILKSKCPEWHTMPIQKLATALQHKLINNGAIDLIVAGKGKRNEITSYVLATYAEVDGVISLTEFDRQVHDAVSSLWEYGHKDHIVTPDMVARAMIHKTNTEKVSPQFKGAVTKSLEKMWAVRIEINASEEVRKRKIEADGEPVTRFVYSGNLLSLEKIEIGAGGKIVKAYHILREPVLLSYAKTTKQLATVDARLLDIKETDNKGNVTTVSIKSNEARVSVNGYLLRRIAVMKNDRQTHKKPKQSNIILFDTLFEETGIPKDRNARRIKEYAFLVLDYFTAMDYIKGYTKRKNRKSFDAVIINL